MTAPVPSPDLREALAIVEQWRSYRVFGRWGLLSDDAGPAIVLADEIYRLRAQLADETTRRRDLAVELTGTWADQCAAMAAVVREVGKFVDDVAEQDIYIPPVQYRLFEAWEALRASGWLPTIELTEDGDG